MKVISGGPGLVITAQDRKIDDSDEAIESMMSDDVIPVVELSDNDTPTKDSGSHEDSSKENLKHLFDFLSKKKRNLPPANAFSSKKIKAIGVYQRVSEVSNPEEQTGVILDKAG